MGKTYSIKSQTDARTWCLTTSQRATRRLRQTKTAYLCFSGAPTVEMSAPSSSCSPTESRLQSLGDYYDLNAAAFHGHSRLCQYLIEQGANVNKPLPDTGESPLHAALCTANRQAHDAVIKVLLANGANPNCTTKPSVETDHFMRDCRTKGETPLHRAAAFGTEGTIQMLLDAGARIDAKDMNGDSPLTWASWYLRPRSFLRKLCYGELHA